MKQLIMTGLALVTLCGLYTACSQVATPASPSSTAAAAASATPVPSATTAGDMMQHVSNAQASAPDEHGLIDGWFNGSTVHLYYTKSYFCEEPPSSGAPSGCEIGAPAQTAPRPGPIPKIYAIAAAGIHPDPSTLACPAGSTCLDHPAMIDASRVAGAGATSIPGVPHSHIVERRDGGWFQTVNIRVFNLDAWNQIAAAKTLDKVRELQGDPAVGKKGIISADTPTNVYFFIASWRN